MKRLSFYLAILFARISGAILKVTKLSSGTAIIGYFVLKICPDFLKIANEYISDSRINVTGTNGKTTTSAVIAHVLKNSNHNTIYNSPGANMLTGIVNSISLQINPFKKAEFSVLETDEAYLEKVYEKFGADYLVLTNLFNDQLDRFGTLNTTKQLIQNAIDMKPDLQLILNADDPFTSNMIAKNKQPIYFGVENVYYDDSAINLNSLKDETFKCHCGNDLKYSKRFYSKIGHYYCDCGYHRPEPKYKADVTIFNNHVELNINGFNYVAPVLGIFNAYNVLGAISMLLEKGISPKTINEHLATYKVFTGRCEYKNLNNHKAMIQLIKNPVGATEILKTVDLNSNILIAINNNVSDGRDDKWINDVEFELLKNAQKEIIVSGMCAKTTAEKLEQSGCSNVKVINDLSEAVDYVATTADNNITILPSYTALDSILKTKKLQNIK